MNIPVLECENVVKCYNTGRPVLNELNLTIPSGKIFGLLGPNGCGKSTLIKLIAGILVPTSGGIKICGEYRSEASNALISYGSHVNPSIPALKKASFSISKMYFKDSILA